MRLISFLRSVEFRMKQTIYYASYVFSFVFGVILALFMWWTTGYDIMTRCFPTTLGVALCLLVGLLSTFLVGLAWEKHDNRDFRS